MTTPQETPVLLTPRRAAPRKAKSPGRLVGLLVACGAVGAIIGSSGTAIAGTAPDLPVVETPTPVAPEPLPYEKGTCLNGTIPDTPTPTPVYNEEVPCSAPDAHYRVIQRIPNTTELDRCNANPKTEYRFSYSRTVAGVPAEQYVYCLIGLGSRSRS
ncbi:hypothetical protein [Streptomyces sp. NBC_01565]|uniref:LppU/SCO3897 family protein n=1 Tax=Streptomyces sp. NBC_01565 TaxID=2975881 RepID=UPI0022582A95|nr:hypothetical protein [Streptomyces sp. NBC_01565]MCX4543150.1 hypothetical protein [Streptomyces sp. NBC_01565]